MIDAPYGNIKMVLQTEINSIGSGPNGRGQFRSNYITGGIIRMAYSNELWAECKKKCRLNNGDMFRGRDADSVIEGISGILDEKIIGIPVTTLRRAGFEVNFDGKGGVIYNPARL